jgi:hypothetical protein
MSNERPPPPQGLREQLGPPLTIRRPLPRLVRGELVIPRLPPPSPPRLEPESSFPREPLPSPPAMRSPFPRRRRSPSPIRMRSPSPIRIPSHRQRQIPPPIRMRSPSPIRIPSHRQRQIPSPSPIRIRIPSPRQRPPRPPLPEFQHGVYNIDRIIPTIEYEIENRGIDGYLNIENLREILGTFILGDDFSRVFPSTDALIHRIMTDFPRDNERYFTHRDAFISFLRDNSTEIDRYIQSPSEWAYIPPRPHNKGGYRKTKRNKRNKRKKTGRTKKKYSSMIFTRMN